MKTMGLNDRIKLFYNGMNGKVYEYFQLEDFAYELLDFEWIDINGGGCEFDLQMVIRYYYDLELTEDDTKAIKSAIRSYEEYLFLEGK